MSLPLFFPSRRKRRSAAPRPEVPPPASLPAYVRAPASAQPDPDLPEVLDAYEAAALLRVAVDTLRERAAAGQVPGQKVGRVWRFRRAVLLEWLGGKAP